MNINALYRLKNIATFPQSISGFITALLCVVSAAALLALATTHHKSIDTRDDATDKLVVSGLNELHTQLKTLEETVNKPLPEVNLNAITQQIAALSTQMNQLREADSKRFTDTLTHTQNALGQELHSIKEVVTHLDDKKSPVKYLPIKSLPFTVVSIDSIQQVPVVSVAYDYKTVPLEQGDALAGWKVVRVDYGKQRLELENAQLQRVLVTHEHIG
jgi:hypothetical protein